MRVNIISKFKRKLILSIALFKVDGPSKIEQINVARCEAESKNSFRGGSRGKGGKIKYARK